MRRLLSSVLVMALLMSVMIQPVDAETYDLKAGVHLERTFTAIVDGEMKETNAAIINNLDETKNYFNINYTFTFDPIKKTTIDVPQIDKEVILVLDKSGSMKWDLAGNTIYGNGISRMSILKEAATQFVDKLSENTSMKIAVLTYSSRTDVYTRSGNQLIDISRGTSSGTTYNNRQAIKSHINGLNPGGGTNVGDAFRIGSSLLDTSNDAEKYFVFLSDGEPSFYSYEKKNSFNQQDSNDGWIYKSRWENGQYKYYYYYRGAAAYPSTNTSNDYSRGKKYAELMAPSLNGFNKSYFLSFNDDQYTALSDIAKKISDNKGKYQQAKTADEIGTVYDEISKEILAVLKLDHAKYRDVLPQGVILDIPDDHPYKHKLTLDGQNLLIDLSSVNFNLVGDEYVADPIHITLKATYNDPGAFEFLESNNGFEYVDIDGTSTIKRLQTNAFVVTREPIKNVKGVREQKEGQNPDNIVTLSWDAYDGATSYAIYKVYDGQDHLIGTTTSDTVVFKAPIEGEDGNETTYKIEAVLNHNKRSGKGQVKVNTIPSILNLIVERENNVFTLSWDHLNNDLNQSIIGGNTTFADIKYSVLPRINGVDGALIKEGDGADSSFVVLNNRVRYSFELVNPETYVNYSDRIEFYVDGDKKNILTDEVFSITGALSPTQRIKQVVSTKIINDLNDLIYAKKKQVLIEVTTDQETFPQGVFVYDPVIVVELIGPDEISQTPLEFSYPIVGVSKKENDVDQSMAVTTKTKRSDDTILYIALNDYVNTVLPENTQMKLDLNFSVAYKSTDGTLDGDIFEKLKQKVDIEAYQIPSHFPTLLEAFYVQDIDELMTLKVYVMYNTSAKVIQDQTIRDIKVGISSDHLKFIVPVKIEDEF